MGLTYIILLAYISSDLDAEIVELKVCETPANSRGGDGGVGRGLPWRSLVHAKVVDLPFCVFKVGRIRNSLRTGSRAAGARVGRLSKVTAQGRIDDKGMVFEELPNGAG